MDFAFVWYLLFVRGGKGIATFALTVLFCTSLISQDSRRNYNYDDFRSKDIYFGISLCYNSSKHRVFHAKEFIGNPQVNLVQGQAGPGFNVHGIMNYKFGEYFDFRALPGFTFSTRNLVFNGNQTESIESIFVEMPLHIRYKSAPYRDKRAFVITGLNYSYDVASNSESRTASELIRISPHDFQIEAGFGMQFFFPYFIFSPEIKFSRGITNTLLFNDQIVESRVMEKLQSEVITISFHFEG